MVIFIVEIIPVFFGQPGSMGQAEGQTLETFNCILFVIVFCHSRSFFAFVGMLTLPQKPKKFGGVHGIWGFANNYLIFVCGQDSERHSSVG